VNLTARVALVCTFIILAPGALGQDAPSSDREEPKPESHYTVETAEVREVLHAEDNEFKSISYVVLWNGFRVVVEDNLSESAYRTGDTIKFMAHRVHLRNTPVNTLHFVLLVEPHRK